MATYTKSNLGSTSYYYFNTPRSTGITIPTGEYITGISINIKSDNPKWYNQSNGSASMTFYARANNSSASDWGGTSTYTTLCTITIAANSNNWGTNEYKSWSLSKTEGQKFSGKTVYLQGWHSSGGENKISLYGLYTVTITTATRFTNVTAGNYIYKTDLS